MMSARAGSRETLTAGAVLAVIVVMLSAAPAAAQTPSAADDAVRKDIQRLLDLTGSSRMGVEMATMMSGMVLDELSKQGNVPQKAVELAKAVLNEEFKKAFEAPDGFTAQIVGIYAKHFNPEEIKALLAFYETPLGQKMIAVTPMLFQESAAAGQRWAGENMTRIRAAVEARLRAEGFIK